MQRYSEKESKHNLFQAHTVRNIPVQTMALPPKRGAREKWSPEEDQKLIDLANSKRGWAEISTHLPGRSAISCRLHYQNYLRPKWSDDDRNMLARLYERYVKNVVADLEV